MVDVTAETGYTPLHAAILKNHSRLVELLIGYGADPTIADEGGSTPLYFALDNEDLDAPSEDTPELNKVSLTWALHVFLVLIRYVDVVWRLVKPSENY